LETITVYVFRIVEEKQVAGTVVRFVHRKSGLGDKHSEPMEEDVVWGGWSNV
jgi:hypothetical protein